MKRAKLNNDKITALYCRLSKNDGTNNESMSISTQKTMLKEYAKRDGFLNCRFYVDDGYSGTNYDRPAFQQLIKDIRNGEVATLITKDLSRLGRNYLETGTHIEVFFPNHNVRYIAINDGVDSIDNTQMDITPFRNIIKITFQQGLVFRHTQKFKHIGVFDNVAWRSHFNTFFREGKYRFLVCLSF